MQCDKQAAEGAKLVQKVKRIHEEGPRNRTCLVCAFREHPYIDLYGSAGLSLNESVRVLSPRVFGARMSESGMWKMEME